MYHVPPLQVLQIILKSKCKNICWRGRSNLRKSNGWIAEDNCHVGRASYVLWWVLCSLSCLWRNAAGDLPRDSQQSDMLSVMTRLPYVQVWAGGWEEGGWEGWREGYTTNKTLDQSYGYPWVITYIAWSTTMDYLIKVNWYMRDCVSFSSPSQSTDSRT